jgi:hypothetical protein
MEFRDSLGGVPAACVLILNGSIEHMKTFCSRVDISSWPENLRKPHIFATPCYICYKPYINVYSALNMLQSELKGDMATMKSELKSDMATMKSELKNGLRWAMMSHKELVAAKRSFQLTARLTARPKCSCMTS